MRSPSPLLKTTTFAAFAALLQALTPGLQTALAESDLDPPPPDRILDQGRIFDFEQETRERVSAILANLSENYGIEAYVAAYSFLLNDTINRRAERLKRQWVGDARGLILVYVSGSDQMTFATAEDLNDFLPRFELEHIFRTAAITAQQQEKSAQRILAALEQIATSMTEKLGSKQQQRSLLQRDIFGLFLLVVLAILVILGLGIFVARIQHRLDDEREAFYYFPPVEVTARYGAPFGGGTSVFTSYAAPAATPGSCAAALALESSK
ncbi:MAG: TPM domain-containing protein [Verrucomicrobiales bacterium]